MSKYPIANFVKSVRKKIKECLPRFCKSLQTVSTKKETPKTDQSKKITTTKPRVARTPQPKLDDQFWMHHYQHLLETFPDLQRDIQKGWYVNLITYLSELESMGEYSPSPGQFIWQMKNIAISGHPKQVDQAPRLKLPHHEKAMRDICHLSIDDATKQYNRKLREHFKGSHLPKLVTKDWMETWIRVHKWKHSKTSFSKPCVSHYDLPEGDFGEDLRVVDGHSE
mmetsp:Transcript_33000/g.51585  ORF Transcript_33000/g.51585 Transcript_33000/m.51585 type:complete len:224 (-) Transcript_33000:25-696(-)